MICHMFVRPNASTAGPPSSRPPGPVPPRSPRWPAPPAQRPSVPSRRAPGRTPALAERRQRSAPCRGHHNSPLLDPDRRLNRTPPLSQMPSPPPVRVRSVAAPTLLKPAPTVARRRRMSGARAAASSPGRDQAEPVGCSSPCSGRAAGQPPVPRRRATRGTPPVLPGLRGDGAVRRLGRPPPASLRR
jgi:hypothetical protein